jgi:hypothetical protein
LAQPLARQPGFLRRISKPDQLIVSHASAFYAAYSKCSTNLLAVRQYQGVQSTCRSATKEAPATTRRVPQAWPAGRSSSKD